MSLDRVRTALESSAILLGFLGSLWGGAIAGEASPSDAWNIADPSGDVQLQTPLAGVPTPSLPPNEHVDLVRIGIERDTPEGLDVVFGYVDLEPFRFESVIGKVERGELRFSFELRGAQLVYELVLSMAYDLYYENLRFGPRVQSAELCLIPKSQECFSQPVATQVDADANEIRVHVPKSSLLGVATNTSNDPAGLPDSPSAAPSPPPEMPSKLGPGDVLETFHYTYTTTSLSPQWFESAPDQGEAPPYVLQSPTGNLDLVLGPSGERAVESGRMTALHYWVENLGSTRQVVQIEATMEGLPEKASGYQVQAPRALVVPPHAQRPFVVHVEAPPEAAPQNDAFLSLTGRTTGPTPSFAYASSLLRPAFSLTPQNPRLYVHVGSDPPTTLREEVTCSLAHVCDTRAWLNAQEQDPAETQDTYYDHTETGVEARKFIIGPISMDAALVQPLLLEAGAPIEFHLRFATGPLESALDIDAALQAEDGTLIAQALGQAVVDAQGASFDARVVPQTPEILLEPTQAGRVALLVVAQAHGTDPASVADTLLDVKIRGRESFLAFPVVQSPEILDGTGGPDAPLLLDPQGNRSAFINPGESRLFNVILVALSPEANRVQLEARADAPGWDVRVLPGAAFDLAPGDSVALGVLVHASPQAPEAQAVRVRLEASVPGTSYPPTILVLSLTATTGVDLPDEGTAYQADADAQAKLVPASSGGLAPSMGSASFLVALVSIVLWRQRRQR